MILTVYSGMSAEDKTTLLEKIAAARSSQRNPQPWTILSFEESLVTPNMIRLVSSQLGRDSDVIVDAVNSQPEDKIRWETLAWAYDADFQWVTNGPA